MQYYFLIDENLNDLPDTEGVLLEKIDGSKTVIPPNNRLYKDYLDWKAEDPVNNIPQSQVSE